MLGFGSKIDPAVKAEIDVLGAEFKALRAADGDRLDRIARYRAENQRARSLDLDDSIGGRGTGTDYGSKSRNRRRAEQKKHDIPVTLGRAGTVKHAYRISGRLPDVIVDEREESPEERYRSDTIEKIVWGIHRVSGAETEFAAGAWDASESGSACFELYFDFDEQKPRYRSIDPAYTLVVRGAQNPHDFQRFYRWWRAPKGSVISEYRKQTFRGEPVDVEALGKTDGDKDGRQVEWLTIVQCCDGDTTMRFTLEGGIPLYELNHQYGFCPYIVIPNIGPERDVWGWSDYESVRGIARYVEVELAREADILRSTANGAYKLTGGAKVSAAEAHRILEEGGVLPMGREGDLEPVSPPQVPQFAESHAQRALELFKMTSFLPDASWGSGGAASGSDRGLQLGPHLEYTALKQVNWSAGLARMMRMAFKMIDGKQAGTARYTGVARKGAGSQAFNFDLHPNPAAGGTPERFTIPGSANLDAEGEDTNDDAIVLPRTPRELFDGDYSVRFVWQNRIDPDDPVYVSSVTSLFVQGLLSLRTALEKLGVQAPEDEMKLIEQEADRFPWLRNGLIQIIRAQLAAQGSGGGGGGAGAGAGAPIDIGGGAGELPAAMMGQGTAANDQDLLQGAMPGGSGVGTRYGAA